MEEGQTTLSIETVVLEGKTVMVLVVEVVLSMLEAGLSMSVAASVPLLVVAVSVWVMLND